ncbi:hypothetical protein [Clostridium sp.]|uniref:hypothetical protein n=1 Tax=Clostridium sp. TaxID=1506 RepID=UPI0032167F34
MDSLLKNEFILKNLKDTSAYNLVLIIIAVILIFGLIVTITVKLYNLVEKYRKTRNSIDEKDNIIEKNDKSIQELKQDNLIMKNNIKTINQKIDTLYDTLIKINENQNEREMANLKDRIRQSYSYYNNKKEWNSMEMESLEGLIQSYENCGGENSFVHSVVEKEMYNWKIID